VSSPAPRLSPPSVLSTTHATRCLAVIALYEAWLDTTRALLAGWGTGASAAWATRLWPRAKKIAASTRARQNHRVKFIALAWRYCVLCFSVAIPNLPMRGILCFIKTFTRDDAVFLHGSLSCESVCLAQFGKPPGPDCNHQQSPDPSQHDRRHRSQPGRGQS
jgi:hypothetical protein